MKHRSQRNQIGFNRARSYGGGGYGYSSGWDDDDDRPSRNNRGGWNWGSLGSSLGSFMQEDDDSDLFVANNESYFTPKSHDITSKIGWDLATKANKDLIKEMSRFFFHKMISEPNYVNSKYDDLSVLTEKEIEHYTQKKAFYDEMWDKFVPGVTPLEKALSVFEQVRNKSGNQQQYSQAALRHAASEMKFREDVYRDPIYNELIDENDFGKQFKAQILNKISLIKELGAEFKVEKEVEVKHVTNSRIVAKKMMRDYSQVYNVELYQRLMPTFNLKLLTKDLIINVPVEKTEHKQKIIILVDYSGSMNNEEKQQWVVALMIDRMRYAMKEEAEIFFSYFIDKPEQLRFTHIKNRETALDFWRSFSTHPSGGGTRLGDMVNYVGQEIRAGKLHNLDIDLRAEKPEILAVNDGQDNVGTQGFTYKTNAISLTEANAQLKELCLKNHGKYVFASGNEVRTYSKSGESLMKLEG